MLQFAENSGNVTFKFLHEILNVIQHSDFHTNCPCTVLPKTLIIYQGTREKINVLGNFSAGTVYIKEKSTGTGNITYFLKY